MASQIWCKSGNFGIRKLQIPSSAEIYSHEMLGILDRSSLLHPIHLAIVIVTYPIFPIQRSGAAVTKASRRKGWD